MVGIRGLGIAIAVSGALLGASANAGAAAPPSMADSAATLAYLRAEIAFEQANLETLPGAVAAVRAQAARLQAECSGVLAAAPRASFEGLRLGPDRLSARARGEANRGQRQLGYMQFELALGLEAPLEQAEHSHVAAFAAAVLPLRWSSPAIAAAVAAQIRSLQSVEPSLQVCSDMRFWAASGFKEVSPATRAFLATAEARLEAFTLSPEQLLGRFETTPATKAAQRTLKQLSKRWAAIEQPARTIRQPLSRALGLRPEEPPPQRPEKPAVTVARGTTAAGERWVARVRRNERGCGVEISVGSPNEHEGYDGWCYSKRRDLRADPSVNCSEGRLSISSTTLPRTTLVRLRLSNGRTISTPPIRVPRRLGGPVGLYYQVVRGPSPIPRLLTEVDSAGHVLRVTHLPAIVECTKHPIKYLPGGRVTLASGTIPGGGAPFSIATERYRFLGKVYFDLTVQVKEAPRSFLAGPAEGGSGGRIGLGNPRLHPAFEPEEATGCLPRPYEIVYGILHDPSETVLAGGPGPAVPLNVVPLPASLHQRGVLVYGVFSPPPATLTVRDSGGRTIATQPLEAQEFIETCEGEAEPGGPIS